MRKTNKDKELEAEVMQIIKNAPKERRRINKSLKDMDKEVERIDLEFYISNYKLEECLGGSHDYEEQREQKRRLWMLSILKHKEDDEFLRKLGIIHISKLKGEGK